MALYNLEIEKHFLSTLLQFPQTWGEVAIPDLGQHDFSDVHKPLFNVIKQQLDSQQPVTTIILVEKLKSYNINLEGIDPYVYLEALRMKPIKATDSIELLKELKKTTVRRELIEKCRSIEKELVAKPNAGFDEMVNVVDRTLTSINTDYYKGETIDIFEGIENMIEDRGNNPINADDLGFQGPFPSINATLGSLVFPGSFSVVAARTGGSKSSLSFYYNMFVAEKYGLPILHLDANEMTVEQIQSRAICCMSSGKIPLWAVKSGEWRKNREWTDLIRGEIWPRVRKIRIHYQNIGNMSGEEVVKFIKRFYFKRVGRGNHLLINLDYIKGAEAFSKNTSEYQAIGYYVNGLKNLVTEQITGSIWTSVQNNREGIITGKKPSEIIDSENSISLSDRIIQQASHGFSMRYKVPEELASEGNKFGNIKFTPLKTRESLGKQFDRTLMPVKMPSGKHVKNYYNLNTHGFFFEDKGDLVTMMEVMGHAPKVFEEGKDEKLP